MTDYSELRRMAEVNVGFDDVSLAPDVVLDLIAELDRLDRESQNLSNQLGECDRERRQLKAENERIERNRDMWKGQVERQAENLALLRKDADRYRWLRDKSESIHQFYLSTPIWFTGVKFSKENVDSAIDSAMSNGVQL